MYGRQRLLHEGAQRDMHVQYIVTVHCFEISVYFDYIVRVIGVKSECYGSCIIKLKP